MIRARVCGCLTQSVRAHVSPAYAGSQICQTLNAKVTLCLLLVFFFPYASISFIFSRVGSWERRDRGGFIPPCESGVRGEEDTQL